MQNIKDMKKMNKILLAICLVVILGISSLLLIIFLKDSDVNVSFNTNGGTEIESVVVKTGDEYVLPSLPDREGYRFDGWYANADFSGEAVTSIVASNDVTYYAKWTEVFAVNLDPNKGALETTKIFLAQGENVYDAVKDLRPSRPNLEFGGWFNGNYALSSDATMKSNELNLTAQYKVGYTVEIRLPNLDNSISTKTTTGSDYVGKSFTSKVSEIGFTETTDKTSLTKVLSENATDNVFVHTFERNTYWVTFNPNCPIDNNLETVVEQARFEENIDVPTDPSQYKIKGYCLLGWSTTPNATIVEYPVNFMVHNNDGESDITKKYTVSDRNNLYGVWQQGYTDMFGGDDYIYRLEGETEDVVYLCRADVYFKGVYSAENNLFYFEDKEANEIISGRLYDNGKYVYYSEDRAKTYTLYDNDKGDLVDTEKISFNTYNEVDYRFYDESTGGVIDISKGVYEIADNGDYVATFSSGDLAGQTINFILSTHGAAEIPVFQVRNDAEYQIGRIILGGIRRDNPESTDAIYVIGTVASMYFELDGFGTAKFVSNGKTSTYKYSTDENNSKILYLKDVNDKIIETIYLMNVAGFKEQVYMVYEEAMNDTFDLGSGDTLTLDGLCYAEYNKGGKIIKSYYRQGTSPMGGTIVSIIDPDDYREYKFLLNPTEDDDAEKAYTVQTILPSYAEYYYKDAEGVYYAPMLVIDETEEGRASLYGYTIEKEFKKVSEGDYKRIESGEYKGLYIYEADIVHSVDVYPDPIDLVNIQWFIFALDTAEEGYSINYWYASNLQDDGYFVNYVSAQLASSATLKTVGGFAFYQASDDAVPVIGSYTTTGTLMQLVSGDKTYYFTLDEKDPDNRKFYALQYAPYKEYLRGADGKYSTVEYLSYDGLGNVVYVKGGIEIAGTVEKVKVGNIDKLTNYFQDNIYNFLSTEKQFEFVSGRDGVKSYYVLWNGTPDTDANSNPIYNYNTTEGILTIDGYCKAEFNGNNGLYYVTNDGKAIVLLAGGRTYYFDANDLLNPDDEVTYTVRGMEYGVYALFENQYSNGTFVELNGHGKLSVFTLEEEAGTYKRNYISETGSYEIDGEVYTLIYGTGKEAKVFICVLAGMEYKAVNGETYSVFSVGKSKDTVGDNEKIEKEILVSAQDWSVLILDEFGRAIKADKYGNKQEGKYTFVTAPVEDNKNPVDGLLYFVGNNGEGCIYNYSLVRKEASPVELKARSYYTSSLKSLHFSADGFAIFNGNEEDLYFYVYQEVELPENDPDKDDDDSNDHYDDVVILYYRAKAGDTPNDFGFASMNFGVLGDEKEYDGDRYFSGDEEITFTRSGDETLYPLLDANSSKYMIKNLRFTPPGSAEFEDVKGVAVLNVQEGDKDPKEQTQTVYFTREIIDGTPTMYVSLGYHRYYITATYSGNSEGTYEVESLHQKQTIHSYFYLNEYVYTYRTEGLNAAEEIENKFGTITIEMEYAEDGSILSSTAKAEFGNESKFYDGNDRITKAEGEFSYHDKGNVIDFTQNGTKYQLYFGLYKHPSTTVPGYYIHTIVRLQDVTFNDYTITVGRTIATEQLEEDEPIGNVYTLALKMGNNHIDCDEFFNEDGKLTYVAREWATGKDVNDNEFKYVTNATYYTIELEEEKASSIENKVPSYKETAKSFIVSQATILCEKDPTEGSDDFGKFKGQQRYVEIVNDKVTVVRALANTYYAKSCTKDANGIYTVETTTKGTTYYVIVVGENIVMDTNLEDLKARAGIENNE